VGDYLTGFPSTVAGSVTVHQLLTHTSGLGDYAQSPDYRAGLAGWNSESALMDGIMAIIRRSPPLFTPGTGWSYSNSGYVVLGAIVAAVSGQSYYDYVREHIFAAAGMSRSDFYTSPQWQTDPRIAHPYATQPGGGRADVASQLGYVGTPAGNAFSTAPDLLRFARALWAGELVNPTYTELMTSAKVPVDLGAGQPIGFYGYGLGETILNARRIVWHNGGGPGISTNLDMYPALDWTEIRLSNYDGATTIDQQVRQILTTAH
jgi:CubicO group peptidase (beta-lactamase class C family)